MATGVSRAFLQLHGNYQMTKEAVDAEPILHIDILKTSPSDASRNTIPFRISIDTSRNLSAYTCRSYVSLHHDCDAMLRRISNVVLLLNP